MIETIQKQGDGIDKLSSLMNELNSKLDRKDNSTQYKPRIHPGRNRGCRQIQNRYGSRDRSYSRGRGPYNSSRNRRNYYQNNNNYGNGSYRPRNGDYQTNNRQNDRSSYRRQNFNQNYGQRNRSVSRECERSRPRHRSTSRDISINWYRTNQSRSRDRGQGSRTTSREREKLDQGIDPVLMLLQIESGQDAIDAMNMTILLENALTLCWMMSR